jgi:penicillin-binding protein 2
LQTQNLPGLHIDSGFARTYSYEASGIQTFGYVGADAGQNKSAAAASSPFYTFGISGLERSFNAMLAGSAGRSVMTANAVGRITGEEVAEKIAAVRGENLHTTIDDRVQKKMHEALSQNKSGCAVAMNARTGEILAIDSAPGFDPNKFRGANADDYMAELRGNPAKPFMNKAIEGLYPPGSTFKIVVALAALEAGAITPTEKIHCPGFWEYGKHRYHCWERKGHGNMDLAGALAHSCDVYFYQVALRIGIDAIKRMALKLGFAETFMDGILQREMAGIMPDRDWKMKNAGSGWLHGDTIISGIGQGYILSNCLQLCTMMSRVATNKEIRPILIKSKIPEYDDLGLQKQNLSYVLKGLSMVTKAGGTAAGAAINVNGAKMGGKTGTSQVRSITAAERENRVLSQEELSWGQRNHGLFVGFAPEENPKYAVAVITEHSGGSGQAARVAAETMKELLRA